MQRPASTDAALPWRRLTLLGPVLFYDLLRTGRRRRYLVVRALYALFLAVVLFCVYALWFMGRTDPLKDMFVGPALPAADLADFAASFFYCFIVIQLLVVFLLTPAYCAGVLAEEKERHTLEALLATDLSGREIVLGLFASRLANVTLLVATGLPILSLLQFAGGVEPSLLLASFAFTGLSMLSLAGLSVLHSVLARRPRDAIVRTYLTVFAYLTISGLSWLLLVPAWGLASFPSTEQWLSPFTLQDAVEWLNIGNLFAIMVQLVLDVQRGLTFDAVLPGFLRDYAWFNGLVALGSCAWAMARLRATTLEADPADSAQPKVGAKPRRRRWWHWSLRPRIGAYPMLWKELCVDRGGQRRLLNWLGGGLALAGILWPALALFSFFDRILPNGPDDYLAELMSLWVRGFGTVLACFMLLQVAERASGSLSSERDRQTLDSLLATPLRNRSILFAKWLGSMFSPRQLGMCLGIVWLIGVLTGGLHPSALAGLAVAWLVLAGFLAALGLWFSVASRTTRHASILTLLAVIGVVAACFLASVDLSENLLPERKASCLFPPNALGLLAYSSADANEFLQGLGVSLALVLLGWSVAAWILWKLANIRFRVLTGRADEAATDMILSSGAGALPAEEAWPSPAAGSWLKRVARMALLLLPLCVLMGGYAYLRRGAEERLREALAEADRLDPGWRLEELEARRAVVPEGQNGARVVTAAHERFPEQWPSSDLSDPKFVEISPVRQFDAQQIEVLKRDLAKTAAALAEARRLRDYPNGRFSLDAPANGALIPHSAHFWWEAYRVAYLLQWSAFLRIQESDADGAIDDCRIMLNAARAIGDDPNPQAQDMRVSIERLIAATVQRVLAQGQPSEPSLALLQQGLEAEIEHPIILYSLRGFRALMDRSLEGLQAGHARDMTYLPLREEGSRLPSPEEAMLLFSGPLKGRRAEVLAMNNRLVEAAKLPVSQQLPEAAAILAKTREKSSSNPIIANFGFRLNWLRLQAVVTQAALRAAAVAVAVERFRLQHGRWPTDLVELGPLLPRVPEDPYDGQPLRYRRLSDGVVIYSVGSDGLDNGGNVGGDKRKAGGDVGIRLWDVEKRRQP